MRGFWLPLLTFAAAVPAAAASAPASAAVAQDATARSEIERILQADNLDTSRMSPREVVETIATIGRGRAPEDFWQAYQAHVRAWQHFAELVERAVRQQGESTFIEGEEELEAAGRAIDSTFAEVERIARRYGARIPVQPANVIPTI
jgi:hypothetical protein